MSNNGEGGGDGFPDWIHLDSNEESMGNFRATSEWLFTNRTGKPERDMIRRESESQRKVLVNAGFDPLDIEEGERLWQAWLCSSSNWQMFLVADCQDEEREHMVFHMQRALQWSGMILLLTTESVPEPAE